MFSLVSTHSSTPNSKAVTSNNHRPIKIETTLALFHKVPSLINKLLPKKLMLNLKVLAWKNHSLISQSSNASSKTARRSSPERADLNLTRINIRVLANIYALMRIVGKPSLRSRILKFISEFIPTRSPSPAWFVKRNSLLKEICLIISEDTSSRSPLNVIFVNYPSIERTWRWNISRSAGRASSWSRTASGALKMTNN